MENNVVKGNCIEIVQNQNIVTDFEENKLPIIINNRSEERSCRERV